MRSLRCGLIGLLGVTLTAALAGQAPGAELLATGEQARSAWVAGDFPALVSGVTRLQLRLPGLDPSAAIGQAQAVALLRSYVRGTIELGVAVEGAREVGPNRGFVELLRRYRLDGTQEERTETVLLGYRRAPATRTWRLVELRVAPGT